MIAACLTAAATLPAFLCGPGEPPPPPPPRVISIDRPVLLAAPLPLLEPETEPEIPAVWEALAVCESGYNGVPRWDVDTGNGFRGGLQFTDSTWRAFGGEAYAPYAHQAEPHEQVHVAEHVLAGQGWQAWPACSSKLGLR